MGIVISVLLSVITSRAASSDGASQASGVRPASLIAQGSPAFHLQAIIKESGESSETQIEIDWISPSQWRRTIHSEDFSQTLIVNQDKVFEENSDDYFPVGLRSLVAAMVDPDSRVNALPIQCSDYRDFKGKPVPRQLFFRPEYSGILHAQITELKPLKKVKKSLFLISEATPSEKQTRIESLPEAEFRDLAAEKLEIIWPQALDGAITGEGNYYVSIDRTGTVREVYPVRIDNERANDPALRQIKTWKFKPTMKDGVAVQAESVLHFAMNTRAWGPAEPLSDEQVRNLASDIAEPVISPGTVPSGTTCTLRIAIDAEGRLIEMIAGQGPYTLCGPAYDAIKKWQFRPMLENGEPRPYRGELRFAAP